MKQEVLRLPAEQLFQKEIDALIAAEKDLVPAGWKMSPRSVRTYICGGKVGKTCNCNSGNRPGTVVDWRARNSKKLAF